MKALKTPAASITAGLLVSLIVITQLVSVAMEWRAGPDPSIIGFLSDPTQLIFACYISVLLSCIWLIRGANNRLLYILWCLGSSIHYFLYWAGMEFFVYSDITNKNIYALNWIATTSVVPLLLLCRYKNYIVIHFLAVLIRFNVCKESATKYFNELKSTDFEIKLRRAASFWFVVEFTFSSFLTVFALAHKLGHKESLWEAIVASGIPDAFTYYYWVINCISVYFVLLIFVNSIRDFNVPDWQSSSLLSELQRKDLIKGHKPSKFDPF